MDLGELAELLGKELYGPRRIDAFLLAAGMNQILEDHLHRDFAELERISRTLEGVAGRLGRVAARLVRGLRATGLAARAVWPRERRLIGWQLEVERAVRLLVAAMQSEDEDAVPDAGAEVESILRRAPGLPVELRRSIIRLPTCFRSLDQRPADMQRIVEEFARRHGDREQSILVVGLRTSGSYLAPLYAHFLAQAGYMDVGSATLRPGQPLLSHELDRLEQVAARGGMVLLTDDPPKTGSSLARAARAIEATGIPAGSIKLLLPLLSDAQQIPPGLAGYEAFVLPMNRWEIQELLEPDKLRETLSGLLVGREISISDGRERFVVAGVERVEPVDLGPRSDLKAGSPVRRHVRALIRVTLRAAPDGREVEHLIYVKGVGLGYFGGHSLVAAQKLHVFFPDLYGVSQGLLFRQWLSESARISDSTPLPELPLTIGRYVAARNAAMTATEDKSLRTDGLNPIWQRIADLIGQGFGRQRVLFRSALHAAAQRLLEVRNPSVIDGSMAVSQWFATTHSDPVKVDYDERAFSNQDTVIDQLYSYDAVFDLAAAVADRELEADPEIADYHFDDAVLAAYESATGTSVGRERWLLYQLLHLFSQRRFVQSLWHEVREGAIPGDGLTNLDAAAVMALEDRVSRAAAHADQRYLAHTLLGDATSPPTGPLCAIDIDGVLETGWLGYSSATHEGVEAIRRLMRHGYRPIVVTGRSLGEVIDRCRAFGLAGGVAEYGAAIYDHGAGRVVELLEPTEAAAFARIRAGLSQMPEIHVDAGYRRIVRASRISGSSRRPLPDEVLERLEVEAVTAVRGLEQTDLLPAHINKGRGVRALAQLLSRGEPIPHLPLALAVGDSYADLTMLAEAGASFGPANSDQAVKASGARITSSARQNGLHQAVSAFLDHEPSRCASCRSPQISRDASLLLTAMSAGGAGRWQKLGLGLRLSIQTAR